MAALNKGGGGAWWADKARIVEMALSPLTEKRSGQPGVPAP